MQSRNGRLVPPVSGVLAPRDDDAPARSRRHSKTKSRHAGSSDRVR